MLKVSQEAQLSKVTPYQVLGLSLNWHRRILAEAGLHRPSKEGARVKVPWGRGSSSLVRKSFFQELHLSFFFFWLIESEAYLHSPMSFHWISYVKILSFNICLCSPLSPVISAF